MTGHKVDRGSMAALLFATHAVAATFMAWAVATFIDGQGQMYAALIPLSYLLLGILVKYGDQAFDADAYSKKSSLVLALPGGLWLGALMLSDAGSTTIFIGILLAMLFAGKLDNRAFQLAFVAAMLLAIVAVALLGDTISIVGVAVVLILAMIDEKADAIPDEGDRRIVARLLRQRPFLKIGILILCIAGILPSFMYLFAFLSFDFGYSLVDVMSSSRCEDGRV